MCAIVHGFVPLVSRNTCTTTRFPVLCPWLARACMDSNNDLCWPLHAAPISRLLLSACVTLMPDACIVPPAATLLAWHSAHAWLDVALLHLSFLEHGYSRHQLGCFCQSLPCMFVQVPPLLLLGRLNARAVCCPTYLQHGNALPPANTHQFDCVVILRHRYLTSPTGGPVANVLVVGAFPQPHKKDISAISDQQPAVKTKSIHSQHATACLTGR